jgi:hypothetical protein
VIVTGEHVARFVSEQLGFGLCPPYVALGIERDGAVVAGVLFNCFEGPDVHVTIAGHGWTPGFVEAVGNYVFHQLQCLRMTAITREPKVVGYARRLGGQIEGRLSNHFGIGQDGILLGILREHWPYGISFPSRAAE